MLWWASNVIMLPDMVTSVMCRHCKNILCRLGHPKVIGNYNTTDTIKKWRNICFWIIQFMGDKGPCQFRPRDGPNGRKKVSDHPEELFPFHQQHMCVGVCHHRHWVILVLHLMRIIRNMTCFSYKIIFHCTSARGLIIWNFPTCSWKRKCFSCYTRSFLSFPP